VQNRLSSKSSDQEPAENCQDRHDHNKNEEELPVIEADADRLRRVFTNLLDNALKFSKGRGTVTISTHETDKDVVIKVRDQGIGISTGDLPYIFDPFHRGQVGEETEGFGVGLAAVKTIVEGHGGQVLVESELGKGSVFTVVLPKDGRPADHQDSQGFGLKRRGNCIKRGLDKWKKLGRLIV